MIRLRDLYNLLKRALLAHYCLRREALNERQGNRCEANASDLGEGKVDAAREALDEQN